MNKYTLIGKSTNSFGDLIVQLIDNRTRRVKNMVFQEGDHWQLDIILGKRFM